MLTPGWGQAGQKKLNPLVLGTPCGVQSHSTSRALGATTSETSGVASYSNSIYL